MGCCPGCLTPLPPLTKWCSPRCWLDDEGPDRDNDDVEDQEERV